MRTAWHPAFTIYLRECSPRWVEVRAEVPVTEEPLRVDDLLTLHATHARDPRDTGTGLLGLWRSLRAVMLLEFKSRGREFRRGDLMRLKAYGLLWCATHELSIDEVTLALVVPRVNEALTREIDTLGLTLVQRSDGYHTLKGSAFTTVVAELRIISARERDDILQWFARADALTLAARRWIRHHVHAGRDDMSTEIDEDLEGFNQYAKELMKKLPLEERLEDLTPEQRLAGLAPEQRLAGLAPEQRLAGLAPEQLAQALCESDLVLALPNDALRALPRSYLSTLPPETQARIRTRLAT